MNLVNHSLLMDLLYHSLLSTDIAKSNIFQPKNQIILLGFLYSRRESGNCRVCWSPDARTDVGVSGKPMTIAGVVAVRHLLFSFRSSYQIFNFVASIQSRANSK